MLRNNFRQLVRTTTGYSLNTIIGPLFTLLLLPLYARALGDAGYGSVSTLLALGTIISVLGTLGLTAAVAAFYYDSPDEVERARVVSSTVWAGLGWSCALGIVVVALAGPITRLFINRDDVTNLVRMMMVALPFGVLYAIQSMVLRLKTAIKRANLLALLYILIFAGSNILFVLGLEWHDRGVIAAHTTTNILVGLIALAMAPDALRFRPRRALMLRIGRTGALLVPAALATWALMYADRPILRNNLVGFEAIGVYDVANKLASMIGVALVPFQSAWLPFALSIKDQDSAPRTYAKMLTYFCVGGFAMALGLSLFAHEILLMITNYQFIPAAKYVPLLVFIPLSSGFNAIVTIGLYIDKRLGLLSGTVGVAAIINMALNLLLIPQFGVLGAAIATAVGYVVAPLFALRVAQRVHPLPFEWGSLLRVGLIYAGLAGAGLAVGSRVEFFSLGVRIGLFLAYFPLLVLVGTFERWELQLVQRFIRQPRQFLRWVIKRA